MGVRRKNGGGRGDIGSDGTLRHFSGSESIIILYIKQHKDQHYYSHATQIIIKNKKYLPLSYNNIYCDNYVAAAKIIFKITIMYANIKARVWNLFFCSDGCFFFLVCFDLVCRSHLVVLGACNLRDHS